MTKNNKHVSINLNIRGIGQSPTLAINEICRNLQKQGRFIYNMGLGQSPFPVPVTVVDSLKNHAHEKTYLPSNGLEELRVAVAKFHQEKDNVNIMPENVIIGPGSKELMFILQLVYYGDIILPTPCWVSYVPQAKIIGRNTCLIHTTFENKWRISSTQLDEYLSSEKDQFRPRLLVINYPSNPDGGTYSAEELKRLAKIAKKYELIILSDEIYGQIHHEGKHVSIANYYPERTIISSGLSKWCGAGGWRLGTFSFPPDFEWLINPMVAVASETYTSVSSPIQYAAVRAFNGSILIERYLSHVRRILSFLANRIYAMLNMAGIKVHLPEGAFYFFLDFSAYSDNLKKRGIVNSKMLCENLLHEAGVAILPGESFQRPPDELTARLSYVNFDGARALAKSELYPLSKELPQDFGQNCLTNVFEGIEKIIEWVKK
jgi:aspartate aminotransferase